MPLSVSELASRGGTTPDTVRYFGRMGLLPETGRNAAGHRFYDDTALERLRFIKGAQWFELRLEEIRALLDAFEGDGCACGATAELVRRRIEAIDEQRARLDEMRAALCGLLDTQNPREDGTMTTMLTTTTEAAEAGAGEATPGCGCCIPPPGSGAKDKVLAELQARRDAVERRLGGIRHPA